MALGFHNVQFPTDVSFGSQGGPEFKTQVFTSHRGFEKRNVEWCQPLMRFNVAYGIKTDVQMMKVLEFFNARQGKAYAFRYKHWGNFQIINKPIATGDGFSQRLPLWKFYGFQGSRQYKRLRKIVKGSVTGVGIGAVGALVEGVDYSINYDEGEIALNQAPGYAVPVYAATLEFDEPVRFDTDSVQNVIDQYNNNALNSLELVTVRAPFTTGAVFAPNQPNTNGDPFFDKVRLLLNFDDIADPTTTVDNSDLSMPVTLTAPASLVTTAFKSGSGSLSLGDTGQLAMPSSPFNLSPLQPFTLEVFAQQPDDGLSADTQQIIGKWNAATNDRCWELRYKRVTRELQFVVSSDGIDERVILTFPWTTGSIGDFDYITVDRLPNNWYVMRVKGEVVSSRQDAGAVFNDNNALLTVGLPFGPAAGVGVYAGLIDSIRFTLGRTRHNDFNSITEPGPYSVSG